MFGHQDDPQQQNNGFNSPVTSDPATPAAVDNGYTSTPAADTTTSAPALLETQATDGYTATPPPSFGASVTPSTPVLDENVSPVSEPNDLLNLKQQAMQQLSPLVGHLDQSPEEKFRTTMMMIQASDNQALLKDAYAAANAIEDEKTRAQALLDVINEINYFTQHQNAQ